MTQANRRTPTGTLLVIVTVLVGVTIAAIGVYKIRGWKRPTVSFEKVKLSRLTTSGTIVTAAISPNGGGFTYATAEGGKQTLWLRQVATTSSTVEVVGLSEGDYNGLSFSPDGNFIYYTRSFPNEPNALFKVPAFGGTPIKLLGDVDSPVAFSPDGKYMAYMRDYPDRRETALLVSPVDGGSERKVVGLKSPSGFVINSGPSWSPDGKQVVTVGNQEDGANTYQQLMVVKIADGSIKPLEKSRWQQLDRLAWVTDGNSIVATGVGQESSGSQVWQISYPSGDAKRISTDLANYSSLTMTRNSKQLLVVESRDAVLLAVQ